MSSVIRYQVIRNHFSILLSQMRQRLTPIQFRTSLRQQMAFDDWMTNRDLCGMIGSLWFHEAARRTSECFRRLHSGVAATREFRKLCHLYRHLGRLGIRSARGSSISARKGSIR